MLVPGLGEGTAQKHTHCRAPALEEGAALLQHLLTKVPEDVCSKTNKLND